jgi:hypothetical protein
MEKKKESQITSQVMQSGFKVKQSDRPAEKKHYSPSERAMDYFLISGYSLGDEVISFLD